MVVLYKTWRQLASLHGRSGYLRLYTPERRRLQLLVFAHTGEHPHLHLHKLSMVVLRPEEGFTDAEPELHGKDLANLPWV